MNTEKSVIMSLLWSPDLYESILTEIDGILTDGGIHNVFLEEDNQEVFNSIMAEKNSKSNLKAHMVLARCSTKINKKEYERGDFEPSLEFAKILVAEYKKRLLISISEYIDSNLDKTSDVLMSGIDKILKRTEFEQSDYCTREFIDEFEKDFEMDAKDRIFLPTGINKIDNQVLPGGFELGQMVGIVAPQGSGKSIIALNFAMNFAKKGHAVAYYSLEMPGKQVVSRAIAKRSCITMNQLKLKDLSGSQMHNVKLAMQELRGMADNFIIPHRPKLTLDKIRRDITIWKRQKPNFRAIIVDLMLNMKPEHKKIEIGSYSHVVEVSKGLKEIALELNVAVFAILQFNRDGSKNKEDIKSYNRRCIYDIKGGSDIEQDCDIVMIIHPIDGDWERKEIEFAKLRDGERQSIYVNMNPAIMTISDCPEDRMSAEELFQKQHNLCNDIEDGLPF
jgi:replicative DNA helicase